MTGIVDVRGAMTRIGWVAPLADVLLVTDAEILDAMSFLFERMKVVVELSGAFALAAVSSGKIDGRGLWAGVTLSGGNVGIKRFAEFFA